MGDFLRDVGNKLTQALSPAITDPHVTAKGADGSTLGENPIYHDMASRGHIGHVTANPEHVQDNLQHHATATKEAQAQRSRLREVGLDQTSMPHKELVNSSETHKLVASGHEVTAELIKRASEGHTPKFSQPGARNIHADDD